MRVTRALGFGLLAHAQLWILVVAETPVCQTDIAPESVAASLRSLWCSSQIDSCSTLCDGDFEENSCDASTLCYNCICSNLSVPALSSYTNTLPTFLCEQHYTNCIIANQNDAAAQKSCSNDERRNCGHTNPETIRASNPISILPLSTPVPTSTSEPSTLSDTIHITSETTTVTPTGTTTVLVTSTSTPGQSFGGGEGNATVSFVTTFPANMSTVVTTKRGSATLSSGSGSATRTASGPTVVVSNGAGKLEGMRVGALLAAAVGMGLAV